MWLQCSCLFVIGNWGEGIAPPLPHHFRVFCVVVHVLLTVTSFFCYLYIVYTFFCLLAKSVSAAIAQQQPIIRLKNMCAMYEEIGWGSGSACQLLKSGDERVHRFLRNFPLTRVPLL